MQPLATTWIEAIFTRLSGLYGSRFTNMWASVDPHLVQKTWANELAGFNDKPDAIKYALDHLPPDNPPTALQFRKLCNSAPDNTKALPAPFTPPAEEMRLTMDALKRMGTSKDKRMWARRIVAKHEAGEKVTPTVLKLAKDALALEKRQ